jgi:hypothetical protein
LRVFENRVGRGVHGRDREERTGGWSKLYNEELYNVLPSPNQGGGDEQDM